MFRVLRITVVDEGEPDMKIRSMTLLPDDDVEEYPDHDTLFDVLKDGWEPFAANPPFTTDGITGFVTMWFKKEEGSESSPSA